MKLPVTSLHVYHYFLLDLLCAHKKYATIFHPYVKKVLIYHVLIDNLL